jgi:quinol monooxygenase YgiN
MSLLADSPARNVREQLGHQRGRHRATRLPGLRVLAPHAYRDELRPSEPLLSAATSGVIAAMANTLLVVHVACHVKPDRVDAFRDATLVNARASVQEAGIARFDVMHDREDPTRFVLVEVYRSADAPAAHKETEHYKRWRDTVADMMAEPRASTKFVNVHPDDADI